MEEEIISKELLDILACPTCKNQVELVEYREKIHGLRCAQCQCIYPIGRKGTVGASVRMLPVIFQSLLSLNYDTNLVTIYKNRGGELKH